MKYLKYKIYNEDDELVAKGGLFNILQLLINLGYKIEEIDDNINNNQDEKTKDILWEYIAEKDIPEIEKRLTEKEGEK